MHRITITLENEQANELQAIARANSLPVSALVRSAVGRLLSDRAILLAELHTDRRHNAARQVVEEIAG